MSGKLSRVCGILAVVFACAAGKEDFDLNGLLGALGGGKGGGAGGGLDLNSMMNSLNSGRKSRDGAPDIDFGEMLGSLGGGGGSTGGASAGVCPKGKFAAPKLRSKLNKGTLIANGCGPAGMQVSEPYGLWRCCNRHDVCFSSCDTKFKYCEKQFRSCLYERCGMPENEGREEECKKQADTFTGMTGLFGKGSHQMSMKLVCDCVDSAEEARLQTREWVTDVYTRWGPPEKAQDAAFVDSLVQKYEGKHGKLIYELIQKYGAAEGFVEFDNVGSDFRVDGPSDVPKVTRGADPSEL